MITFSDILQFINKWTGRLIMLPFMLILMIGGHIDRLIRKIKRFFNDLNNNDDWWGFV